MRLTSWNKNFAPDFNMLDTVSANKLVDRVSPNRTAKRNRSELFWRQERFKVVHIVHRYLP